MTDKTYSKYLAQQDLFDFTDKKKNINTHMMYMFMRTGSMFKWSGLPDTIPEKYLEQYLQINGFAGITEVNGNLYAFDGGLGGIQDEYYNPTVLTVANPYLNFNKNLEIGKDCIVIRNDLFYLGLVPLFNKYASQLAENELSMYMASILTRIQAMISASDDATKEAATKYMDDIVKGKLSVIATNAFLDEDLKAHNVTSSNTNVLGDLIELEQYLKASWYNEIGLNANYNMKREALNSAESTVNDDILFPLVDIMLRYRKEGAEAVNAMYGTDIQVELASSWRDNKKEEEIAINEINQSNEDSEISEEDQPETTADSKGDIETGESRSEEEESRSEEEESRPEESEIEDIKEDLEGVIDHVNDLIADEEEIKEGD